ncbi:MAG: N-acetylmuramoyl-L-alanine amidase [Rhodospirillales bacterium]|nr:N-acetylmuramoyl-L-alanine amidase [Rhodospirillales bacterium]
MIRAGTSPNRDERPKGVPIDTLVLHYTGMQSGAAALDRLCDPAAKVSAHWLIDEDGTTLALVPETMRAWHAGVSFWRGHDGLNARSIGIELVNPGHEFGYGPFPAAQMQALIALATAILARWPIPAVNVVGHSDIAPRRKADPGELFDWRMLAAAGIGLWPDEADAVSLDPEVIRPLLAAIGYETVDLFATLKAFQRRFRPARPNGRLDWQTARLIHGLATLCEGREQGRGVAPQA